MSYTRECARRVAQAHPVPCPVVPTTLSGRRLPLVFTGLMVGSTMAGLDATIVATAGQSIVADIGSQHLLPWVFTAYQLAQIALMPLHGKLGDLFGRRRMYAIAVLLFVAGSVAAGCATTMGVFIVSRLVQGSGAGGLNALSVALVADIAPPERQGRYLGYTGLVFAVTSVIGPLAGGLFVGRLIPRRLALGGAWRPGREGYQEEGQRDGCEFGNHRSNFGSQYRHCPRRPAIVVRPCSVGSIRQPLSSGHHARKPPSSGSPSL